MSAPVPSAPSLTADLLEQDRRARLVARTVFDRPVVLEAGAGTGKTTALVARVVAWLLDAGFERARAALPDATDERVAARALDGVLAITFTEAAAADMDAKVRAALALVEAGGTPLGMADHAFGADTVERMRRARLLRTALERPLAQTIHAWCQMLLAQHPLEAGLHPGFTIDAEGRAVEEVVREVVTADLRQRLGAKPDEDWLVLARRNVGPGSVETALEDLIGAGRRAQDFADESFPPKEIERIETRLCDAVRAFLEECRADLVAATKGTPTCGKILTALDGLLQSADPPARTPRELTGKCAALEAEWTGTVRSTFDEWSCGSFKKNVVKALGEGTLRLAAQARTLAPLLEQYIALDPELEGAARRVVARLLGAARPKLVERGIETFGDVLRDARDLIEGDRDLRTRLRARLEQVLVDEFQDTDPLQCDLVRGIALGDDDGGRRPGLLIVGDPKQSIYGWRSADLAAYDAFVRAVERVSGERERLSLNFRSGQAILDHVARFVKPRMVRDEGVQPDFQHLQASRGDAGALLECWNAWNYDDRFGKTLALTSAAAGSRIEARFLAGELRASHARGVAWSDMAVLMRSMTSIDVLLDELRDAGIPFDVAGDKSYYRRREILDAAALFACVVDPGDHVALLAYLRSPWVGTPDALLIPLWQAAFPELAGDLDAARPETLARARVAVKTALASMPRDVPRLERLPFEAALDHGLETLASLRRSWKSDPVDVFLERARLLLLCEASAAARFQGVYRVGNLERFLGEIARELEENGGDAQALLRHVRNAIASSPDAAEARPRDAAESAVPILTIHRSKGLDFHEVFVIGMQRCGGRRGSDRNVTRWQPDGHVLFGAPSPGWFACEERAQKRDEAERVRLLYVAMTRAKDRLVLSGVWPSLPNDGARKARALFHLMEDELPGEARAFFEAWVPGAQDAFELEGVRFRVAAAADGSGSATEGPAVNADAARARADSGLLARARVAAQLREEHALAQPMSRRPVDQEEWPEPPTGMRAGPRSAPDAASVAGTAIHRALEVMPLAGDLVAAMSQVRAELPARVRQVVAESAVADPAVEKEAAALAQRIHDAFVAGEAFARFRSVAAHVVARELPVLAGLRTADGPLVTASGAIDLVYRDPQTDELIVVDYKSGAEPDASDPDRHRRQVGLYCDALRDALALERRPRGELWYLATSRVVAIR